MLAPQIHPALDPVQWRSSLQDGAHGVSWKLVNWGWVSSGFGILYSTSLPFWRREAAKGRVRKIQDSSELAGNA